MEKTAPLNLSVNPSVKERAEEVLNADLMTTTKIHEKLQKGYDDIKAGNVQNATNAFAKFRESH